MQKLIARELDVPVTELLDMPEHYCQSCGMMFTAPGQHGHEADGYVADERFQAYYEKVAPGAARFLRDAIRACA